jgi:hypothetical protein
VDEFLDFRLAALAERFAGQAGGRPAHLVETRADELDDPHQDAARRDDRPRGLREASPVGLLEAGAGIADRLRALVHSGTTRHREK